MELVEVLFKYIGVWFDQHIVRKSAFGKTVHVEGKDITCRKAEGG